MSRCFLYNARIRFRYDGPCPNFAPLNLRRNFRETALSRRYRGIFSQIPRPAESLARPSRARCTRSADKEQAKFPARIAAHGLYNLPCKSPRFRGDRRPRSEGRRGTPGRRPRKPCKKQHGGTSRGAARHPARGVCRRKLRAVTRALRLRLAPPSPGGVTRPSGLSTASRRSHRRGRGWVHGKRQTRIALWRAVSAPGIRTAWAAAPVCETCAATASAGGGLARFRPVKRLRSVSQTPLEDAPRERDGGI